MTNGTAAGETAGESAAAGPRSLKRTLALAALLFLVDGLWLGQGLVSFFLALGVIFIGLPRALLPKLRATRRERLRNLAVYLGAVFVVWGFNAANNWLARSRAEDVIAAVKAFRAKNGRYPTSLQELVPAHLDSVPRARYTLASGEFVYAGARSGHPVLYYVALPPFGRPFYSFTNDRWGYAD